MDDDHFLLNMYALKFRQSGYEVDVVGNATDGLEKLRSGTKYDAVIFDIIMPMVDGFQFVETIKRDHLSPDTLLIALTNQSQTEDIERGKSLGIDGYIVKASTLPSEVVREVMDILEKKL